MTDFFCPLLFDGTTMHHNVRFSVNEGRISAFLPNSDAADTTVLAGLVCPGFIDTQVNGGGGVQFNDQPTFGCLQQMATAHARHGTSSLLPTVITDDIEVMQQAANAQAKAHHHAPSRFVGIHFEGPHLSDAKKGMHSARHLRALGDNEMAIFCRGDLGRVLLTIAPEMVTPEQISTLVAHNVIVSVGHTNATFEQCRQAFAAGATGATHLFNAMSAFTSREPGVVGASLYHDTVYCGLIMDFAHVHPISASLAIAQKTAQKMMLVTDAMGPAASDSDHFFYQGKKVQKQEGTLKLSDGTLAGSVLTMDIAVKNAASLANVTPEQALMMATHTPARFLRLTDIGQLNENSYANFVCLDDNLQLTGHWHQGVRQV
ncbi:N-acetylglucosamine-6-phosphate deacetylase [Alteromonas lipotrueiana]|uniref:N-acetylglucosamine-6-phosphate deacetylase n=1 Tax=Alteromonas lipotrueiana TaxID=2803815 RepID=UPI001C490200|nr:N-acetylglucosamine-6-phosphate deacetylase [Alteromonas lipotrueiana]